MSRSSGGAAAVTVLTDPVLGAAALHRARDLLRQAWRVRKPQPSFMRSRYRGHFAVTRSLIEGLEKIGRPATYNPAAVSAVGRVVGVLSGPGALRQAIGWKRAGRIDRLLAGPNLVNFPSDHDALVAAPEVDLCVTPSPLVRRLYEEDCPTLQGRCATWPAGVNTDFWRPTAAPGRQVLIFEKPTRWPLESSEAYADILRKKGYRVAAIRYGHYLPPDYLAQLQQSALLVGFASTESQGIAWAEAWSADVPTLLWQRNTVTFEHPRFGVREYPTSTAPYLTPATGAFFGDPATFTAAVEAWEEGRHTYAPRRWVCANMSDEVCARQYLALAGLA